MLFVFTSMFRIARTILSLIELLRVKKEFEFVVRIEVIHQKELNESETKQYFFNMRICVARIFRFVSLSSVLRDNFKFLFYS